MNETTPAKTRKVNILSDIILNPLRSPPPQQVNLSIVPPLALIPKRNKINAGIGNTQNVSHTDQSNNYQMTLNTNTDPENIQTTEESLKRKSVDVFADQETPKKPKLTAVNDQPIGVHSNTQETFFNYMTGTYEKSPEIEPLKNTESPKEEPDIKDVVTIQETALEEKISAKDETEDVKEEQSKDKIQLETKPEHDVKLEEKKPTVTIDLTDDDDDTESNITIQNNFFIQNVLALQNAISLQNLIKPELNSKVPFQNGVVVKNGSPIKNLQGNIIIKSPSSILPNAVKIHNQNSSNIVMPGGVSQPMFLMVQGNSSFLVPQNLAPANSSMYNNLHSNLVVIPNNLNLQNNLLLTSKQSPIVSRTSPSLRVNHTDLTNVVKTTTSQKNPCVIAPKNVIGNVVASTSNISSNFTKTSSTNSKTSVQLRNILPTPSERKVTLSFSKLVTDSSQKFNNSLNNLRRSTRNTVVNSLQNLGDSCAVNNSIHNLTISSPLQNLGDSSVGKNSIHNLTIPSPLQNLGDSSVEKNSINNLTIPSPLQNLGDSSVGKDSIHNLTIPLPQQNLGDSNVEKNSIHNLTIPSPLQNLGDSSVGKDSIHNLTIPSPLQNLGDSSVVKNSIHNLTIPLPLQNLGDPNVVKKANSIHNLTIPSQDLTNFAQNLTNALKNFMCQTCSHKARSKRDLILHIYHAHLKDEYELNLKCKVCNFETDNQSIMEKHDLDHGNGQKSHEYTDNIRLSNNIEIKIRVAKKKDDNNTHKESRTANTEVPIDIIDLSDSDDEISQNNAIEVQIFRCFDCDFLCSKQRSLQNHVVRHAESKFQCPKHNSITESCSKCNYQKCLLDLEKNMFLCKKCDYKTCRKQCFDSHVKGQCGSGNKELYSSDSDSEGGQTQTFRCFHCSHVTKSLNLLKYHAIKHFGGSFECDIHKPNSCMTCNKCVYAMILKDLQYVVYLCSCGFKTIDKKAFSEHKSSKENCEQFKNQDKNGLNSYHESLPKIVPFSAELQNDIMDERSKKKMPRSERNVGAEKGNASRKRAAEEKLSSDTEIEENSGDFKCFHCTYSTTSRSLLRIHAIRHCDQIFACNLHPQLTSKDCKMCLYKTLLEEVKNKVLICQDCGFRTLRQSTFTRHTGNLVNCQKYRKRLEKEAKEQSENESDEEVDNSKKYTDKKRKQKFPALNKSVIIGAKCNFRATDKVIFKLHEKSHDLDEDEDELKEKLTLKEKTILNCFDCNEFCTEDREKLKKHSIMHYKKNFSCDKHGPTKKAHDCGKCIYLSIKKDMESELLVCNCCYFKTLHVEVYEQHKSSESCRDHKKSLGGDKDDDDYIPENDVDSTSDSGEETLRAISNIETDYANDATSSSTIALNKTFHNFECVDYSLKYTKQSELKDIEANCEEFKNQVKNVKLQKDIMDKRSTKKLSSPKKNVGAGKSKASRKRAADKKLNSNAEIEENSGDFKCFHCTYSTTLRDLLRLHAIKHCDQIFACNLHSQLASKACKTCLYKTLLEEVKNKVLTCLDCGFRTLRQSTLARHRGNLINCQKYRKRLEKEAKEQSENESDEEVNNQKKYSDKKPKRKFPALNKSVIICAKCNYRATDKVVFKLHEKSHDVMNELKQTLTLKEKTLLNCFDCNGFCTEDREKLKEHSIVHYKKNFSCDKHAPTKKAHDCGKCIYLSIKEDMESELLVCNCCYFKTLHVEVYEQHKSSESCRDHKKSLGGDKDDDDYIPENDVDSTSGSEEETLRAISNIETDFANDSTSSSTIALNKTFHNFECMDCNLKYTKQSELEKHVLTHSYSTFKCNDHPVFNKCCKKCLYQYVLEKKSRYNTQSCKCCGYQCYGLDAMSRHIKSNEECESFNNTLNSLKYRNEAIKKEFLCYDYDCDEKFISKVQLWNHASCHRREFHCSDHGDTNQKDCDKCLYSFILRTIRLYYFRCFDCPDRIFASELNLKDHIDHTHIDTNFKCDVHQDTNPEEICQKCRYAYIVAHRRKKHVYTCALCPTSKFPFATWKSLKTHISCSHRNSESRCLLHVYNKPYFECPNCLFEKIVIYLRFQGNNTGYKCCECPLKVFTRKQLEGHVRLMHDSSSFQCTTHSLGDIDEKCGMCEYENIVVWINNS